MPASLSSVYSTVTTFSVSPHLVDDVECAAEEVPHLAEGAALGGHVLGLPHQVRHDLLPAVRERVRYSMGGEG